MNKTLALLLASVVLAHGVVVVPPVPRGHHRKAKAVPMLKGGQILMKLAQTPIVFVPVTRWKTTPFPKVDTTHLYSMYHSVDLKQWTCVASNLFQQSTNADLWISNKVSQEFWQLRQQKGYQ